MNTFTVASRMLSYDPDDFGNLKHPRHLIAMP